MSPRRIVLDTDMGSDVDDALALALALASPEVELVAVTHVTRDTRRRAAISRRLLELAGRPDVPVYAGAAEPHGPGPGFVWFGHEGEGILAPGAEPEIGPGDAVDALARLLAAEPGLEIVAVGPLTNLAALLQRSPESARRIGRLTVMGGHVRRVAYGTTEFPPGVDYNLCSDPEASAIVLSAGVPTRLVTADVTLQVWLTRADRARLAGGGSAFHAALVQAIDRWTPVMRELFGGLGASIDADNAAFLHDPLALACAVDESFCTFEDLSIEPAIVNGVFRTLERAPGTPSVPRMRCAVAVDAPSFRAHFVARVAAFAPATRSA